MASRARIPSNSASVQLAVCACICCLITAPVSGRNLLCACTTDDCQRAGVNACLANTVCYVQAMPPIPLDSRDDLSIVRGCIDEELPARQLCENRPPSRYDGPWPALYCCQETMCNEDVVPLVPTFHPGPKFSFTWPTLPKRLITSPSTTTPGHPDYPSPPRHTLPTTNPPPSPVPGNSQPSTPRTSLRDLKNDLDRVEQQNESYMETNSENMHVINVLLPVLSCCVVVVMVLVAVMMLRVERRHGAGCSGNRASCDNRRIETCQAKRLLENEDDNASLIIAIHRSITPFIVHQGRSYQEDCETGLHSVSSQKALPGGSLETVSSASEEYLSGSESRLLRDSMENL